jgi:hypothetical protein
MAMSLDGDKLAIGGFFGAAIYARVDPATPLDPTDDEWIVQQVFPTPPIQSEFGASVSLDQRQLVIGSPSFGQSIVANGAAFVYRQVASRMWALEAVLEGPVFGGGFQFGKGTALKGEFAAVGAPNAQLSEGAPKTGAVYVYRRTVSGATNGSQDGTWVEHEVLVPQDGLAGDGFGVPVVFAGGDLLIGAVKFFGNPAVYHFRRDDGDTPADPEDDTWHEWAKIEAPPEPAVTRFGLSISVDGRRMLIGAIGAAFEYALDVAGTPGDLTDDSWLHVATIVPPDPGPQEEFGRSVSLLGDAALVGAPRHGGLSKGSAYEFRRASAPGAAQATVGAWTLVTRIDEPDVEDWEFGNSVLLAGDHALVSQKGQFFFLPSDLTFAHGKVYVYARPEAPWSYLDASTGSWTGGPCLLGTGPLEQGKPAAVLLRHAPVFAPVALVIGGGMLGEPFKGALLVPSPDRILWTIADGDGELTLSGDWPTSIPPGLDLYFQAWAVDATTKTGFLPSNGLLGTSQ